MRLFFIRNSEGDFYAAESLVSKPYIWLNGNLGRSPVKLQSIFKFRTDMIDLKFLDENPESMLNALESELGERPELTQKLADVSKPKLAARGPQRCGRRKANSAGKHHVSRRLQERMQAEGW